MDSTAEIKSVDNESHIKKSLPESKKRANKKYAETHPEKLKEIKLKYYYRKKTQTADALLENEQLKLEIENLKNKIASLSNLNTINTS
jgi:hypothetical protein